MKLNCMGKPKRSDALNLVLHQKAAAESLPLFWHTLAARCAIALTRLIARTLYIPSPLGDLRMSTLVPCK